MIKTVDRPTTELLANYQPLRDSSEFPVNISQLLRDVMRDCAQAPLKKDDDPTVTSYWYKYVKPLLARIGIITEESTGDRIGKFRDYHNKITAELVKSGEITYRKLNIIDRSRQSIEANPLANNPEIICFVEKDAAYSVMKKLHDVYGVTVLEGHGMPSLAKVENLLDYLRELCAGKDLTVITFTDFNPAGWNIATSFANQVRNMWAGGVKHYHAGLYLEQFNGRDVSNLVEPVKGNDKLKKGWLEWLESAGRQAYMVGDVPKGIELDALGSSEIYSCINGYILQNYDLAKLLLNLADEYRQEVFHQALSRLTDDRTEDIDRQIYELETQRDAISEQIRRDLRQALSVYGFEYSFSLTEADLLEYYQEKRRKLEIASYLNYEIENDAEMMASLI